LQAGYASIFLELGKLSSLRHIEADMPLSWNSDWSSLAENQHLTFHFDTCAWPNIISEFKHSVPTHFRSRFSVETPVTFTLNEL